MMRARIADYALASDAETGSATSRFGWCLHCGLQRQGDNIGGPLGVGPGHVAAVEIDREHVDLPSAGRCAGVWEWVGLLTDLPSLLRSQSGDVVPVGGVSA